LINLRLFGRLNETRRRWAKEKEGASLIGDQKKPIKAEGPAWDKNS